MIFKCITTSGSQKEYDGGDWQIICNTAKTLKLKCIREPFFKYVDDEILTIKKDNSGKHCIKIWEDETFTVYPFRSGTPFYFEPKK